MKWNNTKEILPDEGRFVWVITQHNKEHRPLSCQIYCGKISYSRDESYCKVYNNDFIGYGSYSINLYGKNYDGFERDFDSNEEGIAWIYVEEFPLPDFIPHDKHWDK